MGEIRDPCEQPVCLYRSTISSHQRHIRRGPGLLLGEWSGSLWRRQAPEVRGAASHSAVLPPPRKNHSDLQRAHKAVRAPLFCLAKSYRFSRCKHRGWRRRGALLGFGARQGKLNRPIRRMKAWWGELRPSGPPTFDAATAAQPSGQSKKGHTLRREKTRRSRTDARAPWLSLGSLPSLLRAQSQCGMDDVGRPMGRFGKLMTAARLSVWTFLPTMSNKKESTDFRLLALACKPLPPWHSLGRTSSALCGGVCSVEAQTRLWDSSSQERQRMSPRFARRSRNSTAM